MQKYGVSERHACSALGVSRSSLRRMPKKVHDEEALTHDIIRQYGRYGYKKITTFLRTEGWRVNHKRVERI